MLRKILSQVFNYEKTRDRKIRETSKGGSEKSISSVDFRSTKEKTEYYPDPWDDPLM
jgi:hypothetical protein